MTTINERSADYSLADLKPVLNRASTRNTLLNSLSIWLSAQTTKSAGRGRSAENTHQYGVQKLRELILELAVRGKLVEQDPNDEPASVLLEKIAEEKARLVKEGKIKKQKPLPEIIDGEKTYALPDNWAWTRFGDVFTLEYGNNLPQSKRTNTGEYRVYGSNGVVGSHESCCVKQPCIVIGRKGSAGALNLCKDDGCWVTDVAYSSVPPQDIDLAFAFKLFHTLGLDNLGKGIKPGLNRNEAYILPIAIPPLAEQHRIVKKVDELMVLCDQMEQQQADAVQAHDTLVKVLLDSLTQSNNAEDFQQNWHRIAEHFDTLFTTESSIDQLKQTLLQLAVMGKLVPQDPNDEPASILLEKIAEEKARLVKKGKIKKQKRTERSNDATPPFPEPHNWVWSRLNDVSADIHYGYTASADHQNSSVKFLRITDIQDGKVNWSSVPGCKIESKTLPTYDLDNGDILIARTGGTIGKSYLVENISTPSVFASYLIRIKKIKPAYPKYIKLFLGSELYWEQLYASSMGTGQPNVNGNSLKRLQIPMPPLPEQHRIVKKVDELMALCNQLKDHLNQTQTLQQQLANAVVESTIKT